MPHSPDHMHDGADAARSGMPTGQRPQKFLPDYVGEASKMHSEGASLDKAGMHLRMTSGYQLTPEGAKDLIRGGSV